MVFGYCEYGVNPDNSENANAHNGNYHREDAAAKSTEQACGNVHNSAETVGNSNIKQTGNAVSYSFFRIGNVNGKERAAENIGRYTENCTDGKYKSEGDKSCFFHTGEIICTMILSCEVESRLSNGIHCSIDKPLNISGGGIA